MRSPSVYSTTKSFLHTMVSTTALTADLAKQQLSAFIRDNNSDILADSALNDNDNIMELATEIANIANLPIEAKYKDAMTTNLSVAIDNIIAL